jgi:hypothetical protein
VDSDLTQRLEEVPPTPAELAGPPDRLGRGDRVGRYLVLELLGEGGMGAVYRVYDPQLDRSLALKLLTRRAGSAGEVLEARERLLREAQSMARLAHPNVVRVHDAGIVDDHVYIAMDLVEGRTLKRWLKERARGWQEIVGVLQAAGEGLAAAHEVGLVHRDFKPDNVLVDDQGRVLVADFGLARRTGISSDSTSGAPAGSVRSGRDSAGLASTLTRAGTVVGTPAYMAPEQHLGREVDPRTDQFAFCITLWEALHGVRPFAGATVDEVLGNVMRRVVRRGSGRRVPAWLERILLRGLEPEPWARYPSMNALLDDLARAPVVRAWWKLGLGGAATALTAVAVTWGAGERLAAQACRDFAVEAPWSEEDLERAAVVLDRVNASGRGERLRVGLERYQREHAQEADRLCRAARGAALESSTRAHELACLRRHLRLARRLVDALAAEDPAASAGLAAAAELPEAARCSSAATAGGAFVATTADATEDRRDAARLELALGDPERAAATLATPGTAAGSGAASAEEAVLRGEIALRRGDASAAAEEFLAAAVAAEAAGLDDLAAEAWVGRARAHAHARRKDAWSREAEFAAAALTRARGLDDVEARFALARASMSDDATTAEGARLAATAEGLGRRPATLLHAEVYEAVARGEHAAGRTEHAIASQVRAVAVYEDLLPPGEPRVASARQRLAQLVGTRG